MEGAGVIIAKKNLQKDKAMDNQAEKDLQMVIMLWGTVSGKRLVNHWWTIGPVNAAYGSLSHEFFFANCSNTV